MAIEDEEPTGEEQVANSPRERRLELALTILLAASALLSAWCAYESSRFGSAQNALFAEAGRLQVDSARAENQAGQSRQVDVTTFIAWVDATKDRDIERAAFYRERFRDELRPAFDAWLAAGGLDDADAPATPFELPEYRPARFVESEELLALAERASVRGDEKDSIADKYILTVVLFAAALFLLGIQSRIGVFELRASLVGVAGFVVVATALWVLTLPKLWPF